MGGLRALKLAGRQVPHDLAIAVCVHRRRVQAQQRADRQLGIGGRQLEREPAFAFAWALATLSSTEPIGIVTEVWIVLR